MLGWFRDPLAIWLAAGLVGAVVATVAVVLIAWSNTGSRNIGVATGALGAAILLYLVQIPFELRRTVDVDNITAQYTIDRATPSIRQYRDYGSNGLPSQAPKTLVIDIRVPFEISASQWLAANNPGAFQSNQNRLLGDFVIFNFLGFLLSNESDWQIRKRVYRGASVYATSAQRISTPRECTTIAESDLRSRLTAAGNLFAGAPFTMSPGSICIPPRSTLEITERSVVLRNPICGLSFNVNLPAQHIDYREPKTQNTPRFGHASRFETHLFGLDATTTYFPLRAQHRDSPKYRAWCTRIVDGAREWFES